jgi:nitrogen fixation protein NifZ
MGSARAGSTRSSQRWLISRFSRAALLVKNGDAGEIVQVGSHTESNTPIYLVEFTERLVVGCLEEEIMPL